MTWGHLATVLAVLMLSSASAADRPEKTLVISNSTIAQAQPAGKAAEMNKAGGAPYTNFCQKQLFKDSGGKLYCNWGASFAEACAITFPSDKYIEKGAVISGPEEIGACSDGNKVLKVTNN